MRFAREWEAWGNLEGLPVDLTPGARWGGGMCRRTWRGWMCTRMASHTRRHAAGDGIRIRAVWP